MRVVITAGGTVEPIDDVRVLSNRSTGALGRALALALAARGVRVHLLTSRPEAGLPPEVETVPFQTSAELAAGLADAGRRGADAVAMSAAVADYLPAAAEGKLRSDAPDLLLRLERAPKLLDRLRAQFGERCRLLGFKLLSRSSQAALEAAARAQIQRARLDACLANDAQELRGGQHPAWWVPNGGPSERWEGSKADLAERLADALGAPSRRDAFQETAASLRLRELGGLSLTPAAARSPGEAYWQLGRAPRAPLQGPDGRLWIAAAAADPTPPCPLLLGAQVIGEVQDQRFTVAPAFRGRGLGEWALDRWDEVGRRLVAPASAAGALSARGWQWDPQEQTWAGPRRFAHAEAASSLLRLGDRVLLQDRGGRWAPPGGRREPGETLEETARRELQEELGWQLPPGAPQATAEAWVHHGRTWKVTCHVWALPAPLGPLPPEVRWFEPEEIARLPLSPGVRGVLARIGWPGPTG